MQPHLNTRTQTLTHVHKSTPETEMKQEMFHGEPFSSIIF